MDRKKPAFEYAIICDDIRHEMGDKFSLIGIYGADVYVAQLPFLFPKLCVAVSYRNMRSGDRFKIEVRDPSDQPLIDAIVGEVPTEAGDLDRFMIFGVFPPLRIEEKGVYSIVILINQDFDARREIPFRIRAGVSRVIH